MSNTMDNAQFEFSEEKAKGFKEWVKSQTHIPHIWDARRWFHDPRFSHEERNASCDKAIDSLIVEAIEEAFKEMKNRNKVLLTLYSFVVSMMPLPSPFVYLISQLALINVC